MGDPECQPIMMRMNSDLFEYLNAAVDERLDSMPPIRWKDQFAVCVVMAAKGYPGKYQKGKLIEGLDSNFNQDTMVFHAGTSRDAQNRILTDGGRVLSVTSLSFNASEAIKKAYSVVNKISWGNNDQYYRTDIARNALDRRLEI
jgi:phosphoribosylamine--glycine ligase